MLIIGEIMKKILSKIDKPLFIILLSFMLISIISIYSAQTLLPSYMNNLYIKQIFWYIFGIIIILIISNINISFIYNNIYILYIIGNILLILVLIFGTSINDAKCWFNIPGIGSFQPSEFMKIILILLLAKLINDFNNKFKNPKIKEELFFLFKIFIIILIPSFLTFLEPDTGVVIIYLIITITMLFISGIRYRWFILLISLLLLSVGTIILIYFINQELFTQIFGSSFFLRIERLLNWSNQSGYQLENGIISIGSGYIFGNGFKNNVIYFPEPQTDFIFAIYANNFGFLGSFILINLILVFIFRIINITRKTSNLNKYIISGILGMLIYQVFQNIGMTIGLMPITGITLPFISYGGSSLISYMIMIGIIFNISKQKNNR